MQVAKSSRFVAESSKLQAKSNRLVAESSRLEAKSNWLVAESSRLVTKSSRMEAKIGQKHNKNGASFLKQISCVLKELNISKRNSVGWL